MSVVHAADHAAEHHPGARDYVIIAAILTAITAVEDAVYYILQGPTRALLSPVLIVLSTLKFTLVVMYYMHLKFDSRLFTTIFVFGLCVAIFMILAFVAIFHGFLVIPGGA
jgi:cytochrome c oxidase subunit 4